MVRDEWGTDFDVVVLAGNFLYNIVTEMGFEEAQKLMIQKAADALCDGGYMFLDFGYTEYPEQWFDNPNANVVWEGADSHGIFGKMILQGSSYDKESRRIKFIRRFEMTLADGSTLVQDIPSEKHFASLEQIHTWLTDAGFVIEKECGDYEGNI